MVRDIVMVFNGGGESCSSELSLTVENYRFDRQAKCYDVHTIEGDYEC